MTDEDPQWLLGPKPKYPRAKEKQRLPKITAKQEGGDDGYCYVVRINGIEFINGLTRSEVPYYKRKALEFWKENHEQNTLSRTQTQPSSD